MPCAAGLANPALGKPDEAGSLGGIIDFAGSALGAGASVLGEDWGRIDFAGSVLGVSILVNFVGVPPNLNVVSEVFFSSFSDSDIASGSLSVDKGAMDLFSSSFLASSSAFLDSSSAFALAAIAAAVAGLVCAGLDAASPAPAA